jgi:hypothetical protein
VAVSGSHGWNITATERRTSPSAGTQVPYLWGGVAL